MSASYITKYIYNHATDEVIRRGKKIFLTQGVKLVNKDDLSQQLHLRVRNDQYYNQYNVTISKYRDEQNMNTRCQCPYNMGAVCRHEAAALFYLQDLIQNQSLEHSSNIHFNQSHTIVRMMQIDLKSLRLFTSHNLFEEADKIAHLKNIKILSAKEEIVNAEIKDKDTIYKIKIKRNDDKTFDTSCTCIETKHALCKHKTALFLHLLNSYGSNYFDTIRNWDAQKNKLLGLYGYSLEDDLEGKFEFYYQNDKPFLKVLDTSIKKVSLTDKIKKTEIISAPIIIEKKDYNKIPGVLLNMQYNDYPYFTIEMIEGEADLDKKTFAGLVQKVDTTKYIDTESYAPAYREIIPLIRKLNITEIKKYLARNSPFGDLWENIVDSNKEFSQENKDLLYEYLQPKLSKLFTLSFNKIPIYVLPQGKTFKTSSLYTINEVYHAVETMLHVQKSKAHIDIQIKLNTPSHSIHANDNELGNSILFLHQRNLYLLQKAKQASVMSLFQNVEPVPLANWNHFLKEKLLPISTVLDIHYSSDLVSKKDNITPQLAIMLKEQGDYFILKPMFKYINQFIEWNDEKSVHIHENEQLIIVKRNNEIENNFIEKVRTLHTNLRKPEFEFHFALHQKFALSNNWFYLFFEKMKSEQIELLGYTELKKFKFHTARPNTKISISSGLDWFDTEIVLDFDGMHTDMQSLQNAIMQKQNYVQLDDGSLGLLPEEWLAKFSLLFKMATHKNNKLQLSKYNFSVIDELYDLIDDQQMLDELDEKRNNLLNTEISTENITPIPSLLQATLRPYQEAGFRWLVYLDKIKWGGLLADDMGLGKTIQTLTFLMYYKQTNQQLKSIVICPTTLLYNWENEIKKFTPHLTYKIHHGALRSHQIETYLDSEIIITTYGTLRSDLIIFQKETFDYVILDESQTIKNPSSKIAKSVQLINAKNRIALSGTPMQNNTFDIFSQMNFLNPGMLGSKDFFKIQFAKAIDKFQDAETKAHLKKLIYPFLLRRTKEQVAKDLPNKTEVTLYCEMEKEQRKIYDMYKNLYRSQILGTIEKQGIEKSHFAILQGLMKLRQICDSPAILNEETKYDNHSIKIEELIRELQAHVAGHKVLIFSQFLGMLALIKDALQKEEISYQYFDGSYTAIQREKAIQDFQNNDDCRVFLISLKAGGMGLNLTAADYVYIVDPWWNPAVEQQAIDRTHRIGQTKNIFAYRMICKDTVEEKIMLLKEKKNSLVKDIVQDDNHILKQLSKEDIQYLFS